MSADVRENRLRRMAKRQGLQLVKSKRRDQHALDYGKYWLVKPNAGELAGVFIPGHSLDEIEARLTGR